MTASGTGIEAGLGADHLQPADDGELDPDRAGHGRNPQADLTALPPAPGGRHQGAVPERHGAEVPGQLDRVPGDPYPVEGDVRGRT